jgi:ABC-type transporter Mla maintaining outer membrane lipid asymmetry ATPase subunit MlaF
VTTDHRPPITDHGSLTTDHRPPTTDPVLELSDVSKDYRGLRPLRIASLSVAAGERVAILGLDQITAEVFVNLATGASLPDRGDVRLFGRSTSAIADSADWLSVVDRFGIVSSRAVLLDALTVVQNLAMPFTLDVDPLSADVRARAAALAAEVGLRDATHDRPVGELDAGGRFRVRFGRALALDPAIVVFEHPTVELSAQDVSAVATRCRDVAVARKTATITLTADRDFGERVASRVLALQPATGRLAGDGWLSRFRRD